MPGDQSSCPAPGAALRGATAWLLVGGLAALAQLGRRRDRARARRDAVRSVIERRRRGSGHLAPRTRLADHGCRSPIADGLQPYSYTFRSTTWLSITLNPSPAISRFMIA